jgi:eukaryotic-like serine/threonine-protein kinase
MHEPWPGHPTDEQLHAFSLGAVDRVDLEWLAAHLVECARCCTALEELTAPDAMMARLRRAAEPEGPDREGSHARESAVRALRRGGWREALTFTSPRRPEPGPLLVPLFDPAAPSVRRVGAYDILGEVGRGGMGVVYKARHHDLNRFVALKMVLAGDFASESERLRFQREAQLTARVKHVNIVQVHEVGHLGERPYLSMEWIAGGTLGDRLDGTPWPPGEAAKLIRTLAQAIDAAHRQGVIHRDLKPANILLQPDEEASLVSENASPDAARPLEGVTPKITDFGLARSLRDQSGLTKTGFVVGTPEYMAPEQAVGDPGLMSPAVDVYALGVILYQLLTGQPPFRGESPGAVLRASATDPPVAPRRIKPHVPRDLETIALKAIEKEPTHRYRTAAALSEDLRRFLAREPILARPPRVWERLVKWARREPRLAALAGSLVLVIALALVGVTTLWLAAEWANARAQRNSKAERRARYRANITAAAGAIQLNHTETARGLLESSPNELRNWEWQYLDSQLDNSREIFRPREAKSQLVLLSPDCGRVIYASGHEPMLHLWHVAAAREIAVLRGHEGEVLSIASSGDGSRVASSSTDGSVRLWDFSTGRPLGVLDGKAKPIVWMQFSTDGSRLATYSADPGVQIWDVSRGVVMRTIAGMTEPGPLRLSPDGKRLAVGGAGQVHVWDTETGAKLAPLGSGGVRVLTVGFSPDGKRLAAATDYPQNRMWLWEIATARLLGAMDGHINTIISIEFSPDGRQIVSASHDQTVRLWDGATGQPMFTLRGHSDRVTEASFHPDGRRLVSASLDGSHRLWDTKDRELIGVFRGQKRVGHFAISRPDGSVLASVGEDAAVHFWDIERVHHEGVLGRHTSFVYDVAFSPSSGTVASAGWDGTVRLWDARTARSTGVLRHRSDIVTFVKFHPDGRRLASVSREHRFYTWDLATGQSTASGPLAGDAFAEHRLAFAAGGDLAASTGGRNGAIRLFASSGAAPDSDIAELGTDVIDVAFSPDGTRLASAHGDGSVRVWDVARRAQLAVFRAHEKSVFRLVYSPDGRKIATASEDMTARLWDASTLSTLAVLKHHGIVYALAFNPEGSRLATGCSDNIVHLWDTETFDEMIELRGHSSYVHAVAFSPDGTMLASGSGDFTVRIWDSRSPDERRGSSD